MSDMNSDQAQGAREWVAWLLWQVNQGYIKAEDRAIGENWFRLPETELHPDDREERPHWLALADEVIRICSAEMTRQSQSYDRSDILATAKNLLAMKDRLLTYYRIGSTPSEAFWRNYDEAKRRWGSLTDS